MTRLDRLLQWWRMKAASRFIPPGAKVLDIGSWQGELADQVKTIDDYWGIDPKVKDTILTGRKKLVRGIFPEALERACAPTPVEFDVVTMLAVLEHIPFAAQPALAGNIHRVLKPGALVIITVPSPIVDRILDVLLRLRLIDGMSLEEHYGFEVDSVIPTFVSAGFKLRRRAAFQLGCNNLFVFEKPACEEDAPLNTVIGA